MTCPFIGEGLVIRPAGDFSLGMMNQNLLAQFKVRLRTDHGATTPMLRIKDPRCEPESWRLPEDSQWVSPFRERTHLEGIGLCRAKIRRAWNIETDFGIAERSGWRA